MSTEKKNEKWKIYSHVEILSDPQNFTQESKTLNTEGTENTEGAEKDRNLFFLKLFLCVSVAN